MTEKTEESPSSGKAGELDLEELERLEAQHVTFAQAVERVEFVHEATLKIKGEMIEELERFRTAMARDFKGQWIKPDLMRDIFAFGGIGLLAAGIAVAFHWSYSLIAVGVILLALSLIPLFRTTVNP